jgi:hypothetical protein
MDVPVLDPQSPEVNTQDLTLSSIFAFMVPQVSLEHFIRVRSWVFA